MAALPVVSNVHVGEVSSGIYSGEGEYFGGYEGLSLFSWYRDTNDGTITLINGATSRTYEVTDDDYNCRLLFGYVAPLFYCFGKFCVLLSLFFLALHTTENASRA